MEGEVLCNAQLDAKGFVSDELKTQIFRKLRSKPENRICFDCSCRNPTWLSLSHAVYLCLDCSGDHRRMGVHISFVRSAELDSFTPEQLCRVIGGGNRKAQLFFRAHGITSKRKEADSGKPINYYEKLAAKHCQEVEKEGCALFEKLGLSTPAAVGEDVPKTSVASFMSDDFFQDMMKPRDSDASPKTEIHSAPMTVLVPQPDPSIGTCSAASKLKPTQPLKSRTIELEDDFDFDEAEKAANSLPPAPIYQPVQPACAARNAPSELKFQPYHTPAAVTRDSPENRASQDRLSGASSISSNAFFSTIPPSQNVVESVDNFRYAAVEAAERASERVSLGFSKSKEWMASLPSYLTKGQH